MNILIKNGFRNISETEKSSIILICKEINGVVEKNNVIEISPNEKIKNPPSSSTV